jgi:hypothetical protein
MAALLLMACGGTVQLRLYPDNDAASKLGRLTGKAVYSSMSEAGELEVAGPAGEVFRGEWTIVDSGTAAVGISSTGAMSVAAAVPGARKGVATLASKNGGRMQCEFILNMSGNGVGVCEVKEARFRLHF